MLNKMKKILMVTERGIIKCINYVNMPLYMALYRRWLKKAGVNFSGGATGYIDPSCDFDGAGYHLITIGENTTISKEVLILVHDYSINRGLAMHQVNGKYQFLKPVKIGENCFIGARSTLLPGTKIGSNCIIGACSVVKGTIPDNSVVCGYPAQIMCSTNEWTKKHINKADYVEAK